MATLNEKRAIICQLLQECAQISGQDPNLRHELIFDTDRDRYLVLTVGWQGDRRLHYCLLHVNLLDPFIWIEANNTDRSIAEELVTLGISPQEIILGVQPPSLRQLTGYGHPPDQAPTAA